TDRLADKGKGGEVDDCLDAMVQHGVVESMHLSEVGDEEPIARHRAAMAQRQVVVDPDVVAARQEETDGVTADVAGTAGDEDANGRFTVRVVPKSTNPSGWAGARGSLHSKVKVPDI